MKPIFKKKQFRPQTFVSNSRPYAITDTAHSSNPIETNSFLDLDYIIKINEKRFDDYLTAYHKIIERFTNLMVIYSAMSIFLFPLLQDILHQRINSWLFVICFAIYLSFFCLSICNTILFLIPQDIPYLKQPKEFYTSLLSKYQQQLPSNSEVSTDNLLKASYINELETAQASIMAVLMRKGNLYYKALICGLTNAAPYIICLGYHFGFTDENIQQFKIVR